MLACLFCSRNPEHRLRPRLRICLRQRADDCDQWLARFQHIFIATPPLRAHRCGLARPLQEHARDGASHQGHDAAQCAEVFAERVREEAVHPFPQVRRHLWQDGVAAAHSQLVAVSPSTDKFATYR